MPLVLPQVSVVPTPGLVIARTSRVRPGTYLVQGNAKGAALIVRGDGITVDFTGVVLRGTSATAMPDVRRGLGLLVEGKNVTIKGLRAHGYKIGLLAQNVKGLRLIDCDLSYNWKQRLLSTPEKEDLADWMSFHHNEKGEWMAAGVGAYLDRCDGFEVRGLRVTGGQSGLFLDRSKGGLVWNCDLSFNSALGIGMYRASDNRIMHNRIDYDVRGFSYGVYNRGQDSAGILVFEGCNRNLFAYNSATHGGDGFFLWAGQSTMDTGEGGCNDNLVYANDFSHAPTNGIEATFSRNKFVGNRVHGAFHAVWGGYSYDTQIIANDFRDNQRGIAIEHGQANTLAFNVFQGDDVAIALWSNVTQDPNWGYAKKRDVRSRDNRIVGNILRDVPLGLDIRGTTNTLVSENVFDMVAQPTRLAGEPFSPVPVTNILAGSTPETGLPGKKERIRIQRGNIIWAPFEFYKAPEMKDSPAAKYLVAPLRGGMDPFIPKGKPQGWETILVDEWGPYDFRRPLLWPVRMAKGGATPLPGGTSAGSGRRKAEAAKPDPKKVRYEVLGPKGRWRLLSGNGVKMSATSGAVPGFVDVAVEPDRVGLTNVEMEYVGTATTDVRGVVTPAGKPVRFGFSKFFAPIAWDVTFYAWKESENPADPHAVPKDFAAVLASTPLKTLRTERLDYAGYAFLPGLPPDHYATAADGAFAVPPGDYTIEITTDDGARVWLDGKPLIDEWRYQGPTAYRRDVRLGGKHRLRVEHFQIDGYATLKVTIKPKS